MRRGDGWYLVGICSDGRYMVNLGDDSGRILDRAASTLSAPAAIPSLMSRSRWDGFTAPDSVLEEWLEPVPDDAEPPE